jgi:hypothetical protein
VGAAAAAGLLVLTLGAAQWLELRHQVAHAARWIGWTATGWLVALGAFLVIATPLWHPGQSTGTAVLVGVVAGAVMAIAQAWVTGVGLVRLVAPVTAEDDLGPCPVAADRSTIGT